MCLWASLLLLAATSCSDNDAEQSVTPSVDIAGKLPTTDVVKETVSGAYVEFGHSDTDDFAKAVMLRHKQGVASGDQTIVKSVFVNHDVLASLSESDYERIVSYVLTGKSLLVVNPTVDGWNLFAYHLAVAYVAMARDGRLPDGETEAGRNFLYGLVRDVRLERKDDIYGLPVVKTSQFGAEDVFASILYVKGNIIRSYDNDIRQKPDTVTSEVYEYDKNGQLVASDTDGAARDVMPHSEANAYDVGLMADDIAEHIEKDDPEKEDAVQSRLPSDDLKSLMNAQQFVSVFRADNYAAPVPNYTRRSCLVETHYYIWAVYDFNKDTDFYLVHQVITSHNGELGCVSGTQGWDYVGGDYVYFGSWAGDMATTINLLDRPGKQVSNVQVIDPQPATHQGTASHTTGMNYSFSGNLGFNMAGPIGGVSGTIGFNESYTTFTSDYATELKTSGAELSWNFNADNSHIKGYFAWNGENATHDIIPYCYRNDCTFNQSFIYVVPKPASDWYTLDVCTKQSLVTYEGKNTWFYMTDRYNNYQSKESYQVKLNPPTRFKSDWYMSVDVPQGVSQENVRRFLQSHYGKYWQEAFTCYTFAENDVLPIYGIMNDLKHDINNDLASWKSAGFVGTFSIYVHQSTSPTVVSRIDFTVE